jgi:glycosyltransferase involved in cell wall biosynthesis
MAAALKRLGFEVTVTNDVRDLMQGCDIFISVRGWEIFSRGIRPGKLNYLWCTDDVDQPFVSGLLDPAVAARTYRTVDGVMVLSEFHAARWRQHLHLPPEKEFLTSNGIPTRHFPGHTDEELRVRPRWAYYGSTPFRGLEHLLERWPAIRAQVPGARLHVFSSMKIYGSEDTPAFEELYRRAQDLEGVEYQGAQGQKAIREITARCRVLAYPCIFAETSCITAMEAMASGCAVVSTAFGALPETAVGNPLVQTGAGWLDRWQAEVVRTLSDDEYYLGIAKHNLSHTAQRDWTRVAEQWIQRFKDDSTRRQQTVAPF